MALIGTRTLVHPFTLTHPGIAFAFPRAPTLHYWGPSRTQSLLKPQSAKAWTCRPKKLQQPRAQYSQTGGLSRGDLWAPAPHQALNKVSPTIPGLWVGEAETRGLELTGSPSTSTGPLVGPFLLASFREQGVLQLTAHEPQSSWGSGVGCLTGRAA